MNGNTIHRNVLAASVALALAGFASTALAATAMQEGADTASRAVRYARDDWRWNHTVITPSTGSTAKPTRARRQSSPNIRATTPTHVTIADRAIKSPCWRSWARASTSVVMRVMIRPPISRS